MNWQLFTAFLVLNTILVLMPGPIVTLVISTGATQGVRAGLVTVAGTSTGTALLLTTIASGLSWVIANAAGLFEVMRWAGAVYLVWLGIQAWRRGGGPDATPGRRIHFWRGTLVALTNPKTIAFFTAFLPQFIDPRLPATPQLAAMCIAAILLAVLCDSAWAIAAGLGRAWFVAPARARLLNRVSGTALIGGGIWLSLLRRPA